MSYNYNDVFGSHPAPPVPEDGAYRVRLVSVVQKNAKASGEPFLIWTFAVDGAEIVVSGITNLQNGKGSKAFNWATQLLGREPTEGTTKLVDIIGKPATVTVAKDQRGYARVTSVQPWPEGRSDAQTVADEPLAF